MEPTSGKIIFDGQDITGYSRKQMRSLRREMQMVFQDPFSSLDPRQTVSQLVSEPIIEHKLLKTKSDIEKRTLKLMIVCDEPVSALDVSIQAQILNLLRQLQQDMGLTYIFITHDLSVVKYFSDDIAVMYLGQMVEKAPSDLLFKNPIHPYTKALLSAIPLPVVGKDKPKRQLIKGEITSPVNLPDECRFGKRCDYVQECCKKGNPQLREIEPNHFVACSCV